MSKSKVYDLTQQYNHKWKTDPLYRKNFDYDHSDFKHIPDDLKWMLTMGPEDKSKYIKFNNKSAEVFEKRILHREIPSTILKLVK